MKTAWNFTIIGLIIKHCFIDLRQSPLSSLNLGSFSHNFPHSIFVCHWCQGLINTQLKSHFSQLKIRFWEIHYAVVFCILSYKDMNIYIVVSASTGGPLDLLNYPWMGMFPFGMLPPNTMFNPMMPQMPGGMPSKTQQNNNNSLSSPPMMTSPVMENGGMMQRQQSLNMQTSNQQQVYH